MTLQPLNMHRLPARVLTKAVLLILGLVLISGCTSLGNTGPRAPVEEPGRDTTSPPAIGPLVPSETTTVLPTEPLLEPEPEPVLPEVPPPATPSSSLLAAVDQAIASDELDRAAALCERALRITPRDGQLWYKLASIRYLQGRYTDAQGVAQRALSLAGSDAQLQRDTAALLEKMQAGL